MKQIYLFLTFALSLCLPWSAANAQTVTVCDGTTTNSNIPVHGFSGDTQGTTSEFVIPGTTEGMSSMVGKSITGMTFYLWSPAVEAWTATFQVYMKEIGETTLSATTGPAGYDVVYTGTLDGTGSQMTVVFDEDYVYNGGNLLVGTYIQTAGNWKGATFYGIEATSAACQSGGYNNNGVKDFLPKVTFSYEEPAACPNPTHFAVNSVDSREVELSWFNLNHGSGTWWIQYSETSDFSTSYLYGAITSSYPNDSVVGILDGLDPTTTYYARVQLNCGGGDESQYSNVVSFTTLEACPAPAGLSATDITASSASLGWTGSASSYNVRYRPASTLPQDFESGLGDWTTIDADGDGYTWVLASDAPGVYHKTTVDLTGQGYDGSVDFVVSGSYSNYASEPLTPDNYLVSPQVTLGGSISFYAQAQDKGYPEEHFGVAVSTTGNTDAADFTTIQEWTMVEDYNATEDATWGYYFVDLSAYAGQTGYVAIRHFDCTDMFTINIDDIEISIPVGAPWVETTVSTNSLDIASGLDPETTYDFEVQSDCGSDGISTWAHSTFTTQPSCMPVEDLSLDEATNTTATITWTAGGEEPSWEVYLYDEYDNIMTGYPQSAFATTYTFADLSASTTYKAGVRANCFGPTSAERKVEMHTACGAINTLPYVESFENDYDNACWIFNGFDKSTYSVYAHDGDAIFYVDGTELTPHYAILPIMSTDISELMMNFWYYNLNSGLDCGTLRVGYVTNAYDISTFIEVGSIDMSSGISEYERTQNFVFSGAPAGSRMALYYEASGEDYSYLIVDDFTVDVLPSCMAPYNLVAYASTSHGASFDWTNGGSETAWQLYFSETNEAPADDIDESLVTDATSNPFTLASGLDSETDYYAWVRATCGGSDGNSAWVGPVSFTTDIACPAPTDLAASDITGHTADLDWTGTSSSYIVSYRTAFMPSPVFSQEFSSASCPDGWTRSNTLLTDNVLNGTTALATYNGGWNFGTKNDVFNSHARANLYGENCKYWLITPPMDVTADNALVFDMALTAFGGTVAAPQTTGTDDKFVVLISTDGGTTWTILRQWDNAGSAYVLNDIVCSATGENVQIDLSAYDGETVKIAFYTESTVSNADNNLHIDNVMVGITAPAGEWQTAVTNTASHTITGLNPETRYEAKVQGDCGSEGMSQETAPIVFTTDIACMSPTELTAGIPGPTYVDLYWMENGSATDWDIYVNDIPEVSVSAGETEVTIVNDTVFYTLTGLVAGLDFSVKVRSNCAGEGLSGWSNVVDFTTANACPTPVLESAGITNITVNSADVSWTGFAENNSYEVSYRMVEYATFGDADFEDNAMPAGWTSEGDGTWGVGTGDHNNTPGAHGGSYNARIVHSASDNETYLVTPNMDLTGSTDVSINLWYINRSWGGDIDEFGVYYRLDGGEWNEVFLTSEDHSDWTQLGVELPAAAYAANCQIGFKMVDHYGYGVGVDDITMTGIVNVGAWQTRSASSTSASLTSLDPETEYEVKVKGFCYGGAESNESTIVNFTTLSCDVTSFPWTEDFEYMAENTVPECWDNSTSTSPTLGTDPEYIWGVYDDGDNQMMYMYNYEVYPGSALINTPVINLPSMGVYALSFNYAHRASCDPFIVKISTDNGLTFTELQSYSAHDGYSEDVPGEFKEAFISLADYAGESVILQFCAAPTHAYGAIFVDNITIDEAPSCFKPTELEAGSTTANTATLRWTENGTATAWQICLNGDEENLIEANSNPFTIEGLTASTEYTVKVRAYCAVDDQSAWSNVVNVITSCEAIPVRVGQPYVQDFEEPNFPPACVRVIAAAGGNWIGGSNNHTASGSRSAYSDFFGDTYLVLPDLDIVNDEDDNTEVILSFWSYNSYPTYYDKSSVVLLNDENHETAELWSPASVSQSWVESKVNLTAYKGQTIRLAFKYEGVDAHGWYLDDIKVGFTCPAPADLAVSHVTDNSADLTWTGTHESYTVRYREAALPTATQLLFESFESYADEAALESVWTVTDLGSYSQNTNELGLYASGDASQTGSHGFRFSSYYGHPSGNFDQYLISPEIATTGRLEFAYKSSEDEEDVFRVGYSTTTNDIAEFTWGEEIAPSDVWRTFSENMPEDAKYFAINYTAVYAYQLYVDDIAIYEVQPAGEWQTVSNAENPTALSGLNSATQYEVTVQGDCGVDGVSPWSHSLFFTTLCDPIVNLPWSEDFEGFAIETIPTCWDNSASTTPTQIDNTKFIWGVYEYSGNQMLRMNNYSAMGGTALINSPMVNLPAEVPYILAFDYANKADCGNFIVKVSTDYGETFTELGTYSQDGTDYINPGEFTSAEISLAEYAGQTVILQFFANADHGEGAIFLDNVQIKCGDVVVDWEHPFTEGFEGAFPPACWDTINVGSESWTDDNGYHYSGSSSAFSDYYGDVYLVMPEIAIEDDHDAATLAKLTFWSYNDYTQDGGRNSVVLLDGGETELWGIEPDEEEWVGDTIDLTAYKGQTIRLAFKYDGQNGHGWYIDDVNISFYCPAPTNLAANHLTKNSADLSWTAAGTEPAWQIMVNNDENNLIDADANPFTVTGLSSNTTYTARVRAFFSTSFQSDWSEEVEFTTQCDAITSFPWNEDFEGFDANSGGIELSDNCWVNEHISGDGSDLFMVYINDNDGNSTHQLLLPDMDAGTMTKLMLPEMDIPTDDYYFFMDVFRDDFIWNGNDLYEGEGIRVYASSDGEIAGATELAFIPRHWSVEGSNIPAEEDEGWYTYKLPLGNAGTTYIILHGESQYNNGTTMDNFMVQECNVPATTDARAVCESEMPYTWNGVTFNTAGTQDAVLTAANGCDSVVTMTLTVNPITYGIDEVTACDSYTWIDGNTYTESTNTPTHTLTNAAGCDSVVTLHLTINYSNTGIDEVTACNTYTWIDGNTYTESTNTPTYTLTNVAGCDSVVTLHLTINYSNTGIDEVTECDTYTWIDGNTYTESNNSATYTLTNAAGCDSIVTLNLTINHSTTGVDEQVACGSYEWIDGVTYTESNNTATYTLTNAAGCDSIVTLNLTINNPVHTAITVVECETYTWTDGDEATYTASGDYTYSHEDANGCTQVDTLHLTINYSTTSVDVQTACDSYEWIDGVTYTESNNTATYTLTNAAGCDSIVTLNLTINYSTTGVDEQVACGSYEWIDGVTYTESNNTATYTLTNAAGCDSIVTLNLTINYSTTGVDEQVACGSYEWIDGVTYTESNNSATHTLTNAAGCDSTVTLHLTINNPVHTALTATACETYTWTAGDGETYTISGDYTYSHEDANGCTQVDTLHLTINHVTEGIDEQEACETFTWINGETYTESTDEPTFTLTNAAGCDSTVTLHLTIHHAVNAATTTSAVETYTWTAGNGETYTTSGDYTYTHDDANGCTQVDTLHLTIYHASADEFVATACESYTWNEQTYTTSGDYVQTFEDIHGADSTVTLHLTINNPVHTALTATACETYTWTAGDGETYTISGDYTYSHEDANGCTQVDTLHLTINHVTEGIDEQEACETFTWINGETYTESTDEPTFTLTNAAGCDSTVTLHLTIHHAVNAATTISAVETYTWTAGNGETYTTSGDYTYTHDDANGCTQVDTLHLTIYHASANEFAATACESYTWNEQTYTTSGDYVQTFEDIHGTDSTVTLHLTINNPVHTALTATACETYTWTAGDGETYTISGDYTYSHEDANGCTQVDTLHLTINHVTEGIDEQEACETFMWINGETYTESTNEPTFTLTNAAGCDSIVTLHLTINNPVHTALTATACETYTWTDGDGEIYTASGDYTYSHEDANGCEQVDTLHLTINHATEGIDEQTACETFTWINGETYTESTNTPTYTLTNAAGCDSIVTLHLTINNPVHATTTVSAVETYTWTAGDGETYTATGDYTYTHDDANGCTQVDTLHLTIYHASANEFAATACESYTWNEQTYTVSGDYTQTFEDIHGADSTVTLHLTINNPEHTALTATACETYTWTDGDGETYTVSGDYTYTHDDANGCTQVDTLHLTIFPTYSVTDAMTISAAELPYEWNGVTFAEAGTQVATLQTVNGCDSVVTMTLMVTTTETYTITVNVSDDTPWGAVTGSGDFVYGSIDTLTASPLENYIFAGWSDLNMDNPRMVTVTQDSSFTAYFIPEEIVVPSNDSTMGSVLVEINGPVGIDAMVVITAVPEPHYHFVNWSDGNTENPRTVTVLEALSLTANFAIDQHTITVLSANGTMGTVSPSGTYDYGTEIFISADAYPEYEFVSWNDGNTENPRNIVVEQDSTFIASFQYTDVNDVDMPDINVYSYDDQIVIVNAEGFSVEVFDMSGRLVVSESRISQSVRQYTILAPGIYLVKVGDSMAKKVTILTR